MGILKRAGDLVYTFRFLRLLTTSFEDTEAFKKGIIDKDGKRRKEFKDKKLSCAQFVTLISKAYFKT